MDTVRIILVDDTPLFRTSLVFLLSQYCHMQVIAEAENATQALSLAVDHQPDLLLVDVIMPGIDGLELTRRLKALHPSPTVIVLTLHALPSYRMAAMHAGADDFIAKDQAATLLIPAINRLFAR